MAQNPSSPSETPPEKSQYTKEETYDDVAIYAELEAKLIEENNLDVSKASDLSALDTFIHIAYLEGVGRASKYFEQKARVALRDEVAFLMSLEEQHVCEPDKSKVADGDLKLLVKTPLERPPALDYIIAHLIKWSEERNAAIQGRPSKL